MPLTPLIVGLWLGFIFLSVPITGLAEHIRLEFDGTWVEASGTENITHPLNQFIGTSFSGIIEIPKEATDLDPSPNIGTYDISPTQGSFILDMHGDGFDIFNDSTIHVRVFNDASAEQVYGGPSGSPYHDIVQISVSTPEYVILLDAGIKRGVAPTAFLSDAIPAPEQILNTATIGLNYFSKGPFESDDIWLLSQQPLPALFPVDSVPDNLDITIVSVIPVAVPIPALTPLILAILCLLQVFSFTRMKTDSGFLK